ncbi:MAG: DNA gyrase subunit A [Eubacteriales bacterium]|nr:DNA gyrase subunit A [Eubacteriales bacterium]
MSSNNNSIHFENQKILPVDLDKEMKKSYIAYAMSVIAGRALPDARDGLKPVHRRILYAMYEDHLTADRPYRKSATTVGNVLGRYHPHGDASVYDALVRMAQPFSLRYPTVDGHGNFGSVDGDPPAAYRYTEARLNKMAAYMLTDIEKETVDFMPNFDDNRKEPVVLPSRFPHMLVNGSSGIAVGMATNMPPHNLTEVIDGICHVIDNPEAQLEDLCRYIKGPDFPTGGIIMGRSGIRAAYATGRGKIKLRARTHFEDMGNGRTRIVATEIPYMVNKARLVESIANLVKDKRVEGISDLRDESDREGMRVVVELKRDVNAQVVLNQLFNYTQLQDTVSVHNLALVKNQPRTLNLRELIDQYLGFQCEVIARRTRYELAKAQKRAHILEGLKVATDNIDRIIAIIRASANEAEAKINLMNEPFFINQIALLGIVDGEEEYEFHLDEEQAQAIVNMRLGRLSGLERQKINDEYDEIEAKIHSYEEILSSEYNIKQTVKKELLEIRDKFGDERRTSIENVDNEIDIEDLIEREDCTYTLTHFGYIKRVPTSTYRTQRRGGRGISAMATREEDFAEVLFTASSHDFIMFYSNLGKVYKLKGYQIPETSRTAKGMNIVNLLELDPGEKITAMFPTSDYMDEQSQDKYLFFATERGTVKRISLNDLGNIRRGGLRVLSLNEGDSVVNVCLTTGDQTIMLISRNGQVVSFQENEVRPMGRTAVGVRGILLAEDDRVVGMVCGDPDTKILTVTENGYGKCTPVEDYSIHHRGGRGMIAHAITQKTGLIAGVAAVTDEDDVMLITDGGVIIRTAVSDIRVCGRSSQGVIVMRTAENGKVISIARTDPEQEDDEDESTETDDE